MKISDAFKEVKTGKYIKQSKDKENSVDQVYTFKKEALSYSTLVESKLEQIYTDEHIKDKHLMQPRDIIISLKKPYRVGTVSYKTEKRILIPNNFGILRDIVRENYSYIFVANYLERIGIEKYVREHNITGDISIEDIKNIDLPDIPKDKQMTISKLMSKINERSNIYSTILDNDDKIIKYALNKIIGDENV